MSSTAPADTAALVLRSPDWFWARVDQSAGLFECWPWMGIRGKQGYGYEWSVGTRSTRRRVYAHRVALEYALGRPIAEGLLVLHHCDNRICVNPGHLYEGTHFDNTRDMVERKRSTWGERNPGARLTETEVLAIRASTLRSNEPHRLVARKFGISRQTVDRIANADSWRYLFDGRTL